MKKNLTIILLFVSIVSIAQIEDEIKSFVDSTEIIVKNGRRLMVKSLAQSDFKKANEIYAYISTKTEESGYLGFSYVEEMYMNLLFENYEVWLDKAINYYEFSPKPYYRTDIQILEHLYNATNKNFEKLGKGIRNSSLTSEEKDILLLYLELMKPEAPDEIYYERYFNFKKTYPDSKFNVFIKNYLPKKMSKASWAWGMGAALIVPTANMAQQLSPNGAFYMSTDFNIGKVYSSLYFTGGGLGVKNPFYVTNPQDTMNFNKGDRLSYIDFGLMIGYFNVRNDRFHFAPYLNIGGTTIQSNYYKDPEDNELEFKPINSFNFGAGIHTEIKIHEMEITNIYGYQQKWYFSFKFETGFNVITSYEFSEFNGNTFFVKGGIVWGIGDF